MNRHLSCLFFLICASICSASPMRSPKQGLSSQIPENRNTNDWDLFADLLYWHAGEVGTIPNSTIAVTANPNLTTELNLNNLNFGWDFGFRVGGKRSKVSRDEVGLSLYYTWYRTEAKNNGSYPGFIGIPSGFPLTGLLPDVDFINLFWLFAAKSYQAKWSLLYNLFDWEADHEFEASRSLLFRPYLGLRGGWIFQDIEIRSIYVNESDRPVPAKEKLENHFWGIGPRCGLGSKWQLGAIGRNSFSLFGDLSGSFLWSFWGLSDFLVISNISNASLEGKERYAGSLTLQNSLGLEWDVLLNRRGTLFALRCAYESQYWFDQLQIFNAYNGRQHNALTLQGGTVDFRFNF